MALLACSLSCLLALYSTQGEDENTFLGGIAESDTSEWYEIHYSGLLENFYDSVFPTNISTIHDQALDLKENFEKMKLYNLSNSLGGGKLSFLAEKMVTNEEVKGDSEALEIVNNVINESSIFAKNLENGYACHGVEPIKYASAEDQILNEEHDEYLVFYNPDHPGKITKGKVVLNPNGNKIMIATERRRMNINFKYSILVDKADYPEDIRMIGNIVSKNVIAVEEATDEEICALDSKPITKICVPLSRLYSWDQEDAQKAVDIGYQAVEKHINICK